MANLAQRRPLSAGASCLAVVAALGVGGCGQWDDTQRAHDVARELLSCFDVTVERTEAHRFHATGCDRHADIVCSEGSLDPVCIRVREHGVAAADGADDGNEGAASGETNDDVVALSADGASIEEVEPDPLADDEAPGDAIGAVRSSGGEVSAAEAAIRQGLDARADDVLACVDRDRIAVRVTHHADGTVRVALTGDLAGSPEEGCVRSALGDVRAPVGPSGVVLHLLRRHAPPVEAPPPEPVGEASSAEPLP